MLIVVMLSMGCTPDPEIELTRVTPTQVCAGGLVQHEVVARQYGNGRVDTSPPADPPGVAIGSAEPWTITSTSHIVCTPGITRFDSAMWRGTRAACGTDRTVCESTSVDVTVGTTQDQVVFTQCADGRTTATQEVGSDQFPEGSEIESVTNCGRNPIRITRDGVTASLAPGEEDDTSFTGLPAAGRYGATQTPLSPTEACSGAVMVSPPSPVCVSISAGCPPSDVCP